MRKLIAFLAFAAAFSAASAQEMDMKLKRILYVQNCGCSQENPVFVKVNFASKYEHPENLQIIVKYDNSTTYTSYVKDFDNDGNIFYCFCSKIGETNNFEIYFRDPSGAKSKCFEVSATAENYNIE